MPTKLQFDLTALPSNPKLAQLAGKWDPSITVPAALAPEFEAAIPSPLNISVTLASGFAGSTLAETVTIEDDLTELGIEPKYTYTVASTDFASYGWLGSIAASIAAKIFPPVSETVSGQLSVVTTPDPVVTTE